MMMLVVMVMVMVMVCDRNGWIYCLANHASLRRVNYVSISFAATNTSR